MAQYITTLTDMIGAVRQVKPNCPAPMARDFLNERVRATLSRKTVWAGLRVSGTIYLPAAYSAGTISLTPESRLVTGSSTDWPVSDKVNTTIPSAITEPGVVTITPASMAGITADSLLFIDGGGASEEVVSVLEVGRTAFRAVVTVSHGAGATLTCSSLAGRQIRIGNGGSYPVFTIDAVRSATSALLDSPWPAGALFGQAYSILKMRHTIHDGIKDLLSVVDPTQSVDLKLHYPQSQLDRDDPARVCAGDPKLVSEYAPNVAGNMQYEIYPPQTSARLLSFTCSRQWPEMKRNGDRPPHFINPNVFVFGARADALRTKVGEQDPYLDPRAADSWEMRAEVALQAAMLEDDGKALDSLTREVRQDLPRGANWDQSHDVSSGGTYW